MFAELCINSTGWQKIPGTSEHTSRLKALIRISYHLIMTTLTGMSRRGRLSSIFGVSVGFRDGCQMIILRSFDLG